MDALYTKLKEVFGYSQFRHSQEAIIRSVLEGKDNLVIMPTGGGKSICYQLPALLLEGITVVISPLIALMDDQVAALNQLGVSAVSIHSGMNTDERSAVYNRLNDGKIKLIYLSPEGFLSRDMFTYLQNLPIELFAIDEAHCVSVWGNDFRPDYVKLSCIKDQFPSIPVIALTATADITTQEDIVKQLRLAEANVSVASFERENISVAVSPGQQRIDQIYRFIADNDHKAGIIYCLSRKGCESTAAKLEARGYKADYYHAGRTAEDRSRVQQAFQNDEITIICATIAFGMGIDKPNIRYVIHYNLPKNIEGYYQEIGRAGRDGNPSQTLLFHSWADYTQLKTFIDDSKAEESFKEVQYAKLERMWQYANAENCRTNFILNYFGEYRTEPCGHCDNCIHPPNFIDGATYAKMAVSAVIRANQTMGQRLVVDVLRGSYKAEIKALGLDQIKTYGVGREVPFQHWMHYINQMINAGILRVDFTDKYRVKTTPLSMAVLQDEIPVKLTKFVSLEAKAKTKKKVKSSLGDLPMDEQVFEALKKWRLRVAKKKKVPPYVIFHDRHLKSIARILPRNEQELLNADGIGKKKMDDYGSEILEIVLRTI